jgi:SAM-dependent methyltransferase
MNTTVGSISMDLQPKPCPICKAGDNSDLFREGNIDETRLTSAAFSSRKLPEYMHLRLMRCRTCDLVYSSPAPSLEFLSTSYRDASFDAGKESAYAAATYFAYLRKMKRAVPRPALDIGAGDGAFLRQLVDHGFTDATGYEPSMAPVQAADPAIRGRIIPKLFDPSEVPAASLGLVTCFQTIEHVYDPLTLVSEMQRILYPGGTAFLVGHNVDAFSARLMGEKSPIFDIEHLQLLNRRSATALMEAAGFRDVSVFPIYNAYPIAYWAKLFPIPGSMKTGFLALLNGPMKWLGDRTLPLPAGNLGILATK